MSLKKTLIRKIHGIAFKYSGMYILRFEKKTSYFLSQYFDKCINFLVINKHDNTVR